MLVPEPIFAQKVLKIPDITITTDKPSYIFGDTIMISGTVKTIVPGNAVNIQILDPYSNLIQTRQVNVTQDGSYTDAIEITGFAWKTSGAYTIYVQYGSKVQTQTTFAFIATTAPINGVFQVKITIYQKVFDVQYTISGGSVNRMYVDPPNLSLTVSIQSRNYGAITLSLPRSLLDAKASDGTDSSFTILVDGVKIKPQKEQATTTDRILTIQFLQGDQNIQIIGTTIASQNNLTANMPNANLITDQNLTAQITNMSKPIQKVPEFHNETFPLITGLITILVFVRTNFNK